MASVVTEGNRNERKRREMVTDGRRVGREERRKDFRSEVSQGYYLYEYQSTTE